MAMSQRCSQREGPAATAGGRSQSSTPADGEVQIGLNILIFRNGLGALECGRILRRQRRSVFIHNMEYQRAMELSNNAQSIARPVLSVAQLLLQSIRSRLSRAYFGGTELQENCTQNVGPTILSTDVLRRMRYAVG